MVLQIRQEKPEDYDSVFNVVQQAFANVPYSDHSEPFLVQRLRQSKSFIPELSLVAIFENKVIGHILLTKIKIGNRESESKALALAPVSVLPEYQKRGIGSQLMVAAHKQAKALGYTSVVLVGHADYYPRYGYLPATNFGINFPFEVPPENGMVLELKEGSLAEVSGTVIYDDAFGI